MADYQGVDTNWYNLVRFVLVLIFACCSNSAGFVSVLAFLDQLCCLNMNFYQHFIHGSQNYNWTDWKDELGSLVKMNLLKTTNQNVKRPALKEKKKKGKDKLGSKKTGEKQMIWIH
jgi:hypothetical protein